MHTNSKTPTCSNCGGSEFHQRNFSTMGHASALLPVGFFDPREVRLRVCGSCGLMQYFARPRTLEAVKKKFEKE